MTQFPDDFLWGVSTASYQIEGAVREDGRGPSIWDTFSHLPDKIVNADNGDVACDHYHRYRDDIALMSELGIDAYRFSTAWPRIQPAGRGPVNKAGLDFYERLVDGLLAEDIQPWLCLYHWDLPQRLEDQGGWRNRDTAARFTDYAWQVHRRLGDRVRHFITFNEPAVFVLLGYGAGIHAPGVAERAAVFEAIHHVNLAHGMAVKMLRQEDSGLKIGAVNALNPMEPLSDSYADQDATDYADALNNRAQADPQYLGHYPALLAADLEPVIQEDDMATIHQPLDFFGLNSYTSNRIFHDPTAEFGYGFAGPPSGTPTTAMDWAIDPDGFHRQLMDIQQRYGPIPIYITENGAGFEEQLDQQGKLHDPRRVGYLGDYLAALQQAIQDGAEVKGYFVWSLLDNFEWSLGYAKRFGLVHVDYATQTRTPKDSFRFYQQVVAENRLP